MTEEIRAIETTYAGCRFRSRLEARWAVFFDALGTPWEYEPEGVIAEDGTKYLPDFWLPEMRVWVEVKAVADRTALNKMMAAVPSLKPNQDRQFQPVLLVLGPVPRPGHGWAHTCLCMIGDSILWQQSFIDGPNWHVNPYGPPLRLAATAFDEATDEQVVFFGNFLTESAVAVRLTIDPTIDGAYAAARAARFEFGERG